MTIPELYDKLASDGFKDYETGNIFFPAYMYMYKAEDEYKINADIEDIKHRLHRPSNYLDIMVLDIYEEFIAYLKQAKMAKTTKFEFYMMHEAKKQPAVEKALFKDAYDPKFLEFLNTKIKEHLATEDSYQRSYVFFKGFGNAFPYIRTSRFFNNFEKYVKGYKLIMFYPGEAKEYYSLFGLLKDENLYRAIKLINE
jgi:hypothetical protein